MYEAGIRANYHESSDCFNFEYPPKIPAYSSSYPKNTCQNFPTRKSPEIESSNPKKSFDHPPCHLKSGVPHGCPWLPVVYPPTFSQSNEIEIWEIFALSLGRDFRNCPSDFRGFPTIFRRLPKTSEDVQANFDHFRSHLIKRRQFKRVLISLGHAKSSFNALLEHFHGNWMNFRRLFGFVSQAWERDTSDRCL